MLKTLTDILTDYKFFLELFLSVPFAILANLLTPKIDKFLSSRNSQIEKFLSSRNSQLKQKRIIKIKQEYQKVKQYYENRMMLVEYLLANILETISLAVVIILYVTVIDSLFPASMSANSLSKIFVILGSLVIVNWTTNALKIYTKVKHYNDYQKEVSDIIQE
ncbi:hypothetical protein [Okeania sp. KiyG1]|uniref:hypothetical protein n=1 Tax=Okeania sp. KiyG1 TaxID=2720165 RepID=UPI0019240BEE|nr:hypothetical protein [Okeania sp. KiyG1]GGA14330.1 hypothetical protein CYANOKiyG1_27830 [Okeania sp. KiyG1]